MITKMKKLTFLIYHKEYEQFLEQIRELGVVHIVEKQCGEMDDRLQRFMQKRALYKNTLNAMNNLAGKDLSATVRTGVSADEVVSAYEDLQSHIQELGQKLPQLDKDIAQMQVYRCRFGVISTGPLSVNFVMLAGTFSFIPVQRKNMTKLGSPIITPSVFRSRVGTFIL